MNEPLVFAIVFFATIAWGRFYLATTECKEPGCVLSRLHKDTHCDFDGKVW